MELTYFSLFVFLIAHKVCCSTLQGSENWLTFTNGNEVKRLNMATNVTEIVINGLRSAIALDIHYEKGFVYWSDVVSTKISRTLVTKKSVSQISEGIIKESVSVPDGIAIDWIYDLLYWTDTALKHIQVSRLDGTYRRTIVKFDSLQKPRAIVVDPTTGWLFFSDWGIKPRIERCRMDGADRMVIVDTDIVWPNGMSIDIIGQRLYWIDGSLNQIKCTRYDGSDTYTIIKRADLLPHPFGLVVFDSYIYWSNWEYRSIRRVNKYAGQDTEFVTDTNGRAMGIKLYAAEAQIKSENVCGENNGCCSHICFPLAVINTTKSTLSSCMCPDFYALQADQKTCVAIDSLPQLQVTIPEIDVKCLPPITSSPATLQSTVTEDSTVGQTKENSKVGAPHGDPGMILYPSIIGGTVLIVILVIILRRRRLRQCPKHGKNTEEIPNSRDSSNSLYDFIPDDFHPTGNQQMPDSNNYTCVTYESLKTSCSHAEEAYTLLNIPAAQHEIKGVKTKENIIYSNDEVLQSHSRSQKEQEKENRKEKGKKEQQ